MIALSILEMHGLTKKAETVSMKSTQASARKNVPTRKIFALPYRIYHLHHRLTWATTFAFYAHDLAAFLRLKIC